MNSRKKDLDDGESQQDRDPLDNRSTKRLLEKLARELAEEYVRITKRRSNPKEEE